MVTSVGKKIGVGLFSFLTFMAQETLGIQERGGRRAPLKSWLVGGDPVHRDSNLRPGFFVCLAIGSVAT